MENRQCDSITAPSAGGSVSATGMLTWLGWNPWQCKRCHTRSYLRFRF